MKKIILTSIIAILGTYMPAYAIPPPTPIQYGCNEETYGNGEDCVACPNGYASTNYHSFTKGDFCDDDCAIERGYCTPIQTNEPNNAPARINTNNTDCDNETLGTYTGPTTLAAQWNPNTINLNWYTDSVANGGTTINVVNTNAASCEYDGRISLPNQPTKPGYEFAGWVVRQTATITLSDCNNDEETCSQCAELFPEENFISWGYLGGEPRCCREGGGCIGGSN